MADKLREMLDSGGWISPEVRKEYDRAILECAVKVLKYNSKAMETVDDIRNAFEDITCQKLDESSLVVFPFR